MNRWMCLLLVALLLFVASSMFNLMTKASEEPVRIPIWVVEFYPSNMRFQETWTLLKRPIFRQGNVEFEYAGDTITLYGNVIVYERMVSEDDFKPDPPEPKYVTK